MKIKGQCWTCKRKAIALVGKDKTPLCEVHRDMRIMTDKSIPSQLGLIVTKALNKVTR